MLINRRLYLYEPADIGSAEGYLTLGGISGRAHCTGKTSSQTLTVETMTGTKKVVQYYDEFEGLDERYRLAGGGDDPQWEAVEPRLMGRTPS